MENIGKDENKAQQEENKAQQGEEGEEGEDTSKSNCFFHFVGKPARAPNTAGNSSG